MLSKILRLLYAYSKHRVMASAYVEPLRRRKRRKNIFKKHSPIINSLLSDGIYVIPDYLSEEQCDEACLELSDVFATKNQFVQSKDDKRVFGVECYVEAAAWLKNDTLLSEIAEYLNGEPSEAFFVLGGSLKAGKNGSSGGGWHRDAYYSQVKGMIYLTDVTLNTGPFEYVKGSHKLSSVIRQHRNENIKLLQDRYSDAEAQTIIENDRRQKHKVVGRRGTLVLFNSTGLHRGSPILEGQRLTLTSYIFPIRLRTSNIINNFKPVAGFRSSS